MIDCIIPRATDDPVGGRNLERVAGELKAAGVSRVSVSKGSPDDVWRLAEESKSDWLWIHYPDLLLPFEEIVTAIKTCRYPALKPYRSYQRLSQTQSENDEKPPANSPAQGESFGKASFVVRRELFLALGGLHQELFLDGDEGFEFAKRLRWFFPKVPELECYGRLLYRPQSADEKRERNRSRELRKALQSKFDDSPEQYLTDFPRAQPDRLKALVKAQALAFTDPHPPPRNPKSLPGTIWGLTTYFNPENYESKRRNFQLFKESLEMPLCVVELAFEDRDFELDERDADLLVQLRGGDILWQKEQLLNVGLGRLPEDCDKVCWLDADVLFENSKWAEEAAALLEEHVVVQPFSLSVRLEPGETTCEAELLPLGSAEHEVLHSMAYGVAAKGLDCLSSYLAHGHSGYAWAARRSVLAKHGFYRANVLGNADLNIAQAMFGGERYLKTDRLSPLAREHLSSWANAFYADVQGSVSYVEGTLFHLWHGYKKNRLYHGRLEVLIDYDFDPDNDLAISETGPLIWSSNKPGLHQWCKEYFGKRDEDTV